MRGNLREKLNTEVTRKQFIQYIGIALLMLFGLHNFLQLLGSDKHGVHGSLLQPLGNGATDSFGTRRFGK